MKREDIIRMAWEAGFAIVDKHILADNENGPEHVICTEAINRFAALVAAAEREACESEYPVKFASVQGFEDWCASIRANEREACAKWLEERDAPYWAEQIRAMGQQ